jgi:lipopolysaccharide export LptBFGC system permease protein LptF
VLGFLPEQLLLFSMMALPLAMVTAFLAVIGRMREEGELTALMAAGVGTWHVSKALLPVAAVIALYLALGGHLLMPDLTRRLMEGKNDLLRQALSAKVERRAPIWQAQGAVLAAHAAEEDRLLGVFGVRTGAEGEVMAGFAPEGRWVADAGDEDEDESGPALGLELRDVRLLVREAGADGRWATATVPAWSARLPLPRRDYANQADSLSTYDLWQRIGTVKEVDRKSIRRARSLERAWHLRWMLPVGIFAYWIFACGLGFAAGRGNRMLSVCLGIVTVVAVLFPSYVLAKEVGERLTIDAGWWVWPPPILLAVFGSWLAWRHR